MKPQLTAALLLLSAAVAAAQGQPPARVRGQIDAVDNLVLRVKSRDGSMLTVRLAENVAVAGLTTATLADATPGKFVGVAALPQGDGTLRALEVLIFPDAMRGTGEGHYPWDLQPQSTMTNATVADVVGAAQGRVLTLRYKDGEKKVVVPDGAPIVTFVPGDRSRLVPGAHIFIFAAQRQPDGTFTASRITVGLNGLVPPM